MIECDYCSDNVAVDGWHYYFDAEDGSSYRVPCVNDPPKEGA